MKQSALGNLPGIETVFSPDRLYRYRWSVRVGPQLHRLLWILLNPSTANEVSTDPTVAKTIRFALRWKFGMVEIVNVFAWRSTDPKALRKTRDPVGELNDYHILCAARLANRIVLGWGKHAGDRGIEVYKQLRDDALVTRDLYCLKVNLDGSPIHPLYVAESTEPIVWMPR